MLPISTTDIHGERIIFVGLSEGDMRVLREAGSVLVYPEGKLPELLAICAPGEEVPPGDPSLWRLPLSEWEFERLRDGKLVVTHSERWQARILLAHRHSDVQLAMELRDLILAIAEDEEGPEC